MGLDITKISLDGDFLIIVLTACLASSVIGGGIIWLIMRKVFLGNGLNAHHDTHKLSFAIGALERALYTISICFSAYVLIGGWLVLKGFSNFDGHTQNLKAAEKGMRSFYTYLLGNILSLFIGSICGFIALYFIIKENYP